MIEAEFPQLKTQFTGVKGYLEAVDLMMAPHRQQHHPDWKFHTMEGLILHYGKPYTWAPKPKGVRFGKVKECFSNASRMIIGSDRFNVVEGYAAGLIPTMHAWLTEDGEHAVEVTWRQAQNPHEYYGIAFANEYVKVTMLKTGYWGVFGSDHRELLEGFLRNGIPDEALAY